MSIRRRLVWLVLAILLPTLLFALFITYSVYQSQWKRVSTSMQETTRAVALAVDRDLARYEAIASTIAISPGLVQGNLATFHARVREAVEPLGSSVTVFDLDGIPLMDTRQPYGAPLPMPPSLPRLLPSAGMDVSPLYTDPDDGSLAFAIHTPVMRNGRVVYYLSMEFSAAQLGAVLVEQGLPERWLGVVLDSQYRIVARTREPAAHIGERASEHIRKELVAQPAGGGATESVTRDGMEVMTFFSRGGKSGWTVLIAIPRHELLQNALAPLGAVLVGFMLVLVLALALAFMVGRTITRPLGQLDRAAQALARGERVDAPPTGMTETDRTAWVLADASQKIHRANAEMAERVAEALGQAERSHQALLQGQKLEALGRLTGGIAHDFNNLLQSMNMGLQLAYMLSTNERVKRALESCQRSVTRGTQLTRQLMTFSRNRADEAKPVDLRELILGMSELLNGALPRRVQTVLHLPEGGWPTVVDPLQCELAILNIALNARDAMPDGGCLTIGLVAARLEVGNGQGLAEGPYIELSLTDTGQGMTKDVIAKAFEPFFTTKGVGEGTGLGLAQVYGFARQSSGAVTIQSELARGTRVSVWLPWVDKDEVRDLPREAETPMTGTARVLLVDDDAEVRDVVAPMLEQLGYRVEVAGDADAALARFDAANQPEIDVLFSDILMPGSMDGVGLAQTVRALFPDMPILLATGYTERAPGEHGFKVLAKPFDIEVLAAALRDIANTGRQSGAATPG